MLATIFLPSWYIIYCCKTILSDKKPIRNLGIAMETRN